MFIFVPVMFINHLSLYKQCSGRTHIVMYGCVHKSNDSQTRLLLGMTRYLVLNVPTINNVRIPYWVTFTSLSLIEKWFFLGDPQTRALKETRTVALALQ